MYEKCEDKERLIDGLSFPVFLISKVKRDIFHRADKSLAVIGKIAIYEFEMGWATPNSELRREKEEYRSYIRATFDLNVQVKLRKYKDHGVEKRGKRAGALA